MLIMLLATYEIYATGLIQVIEQFHLTVQVHDGNIMNIQRIVFCDNYQE